MSKLPIHRAARPKIKDKVTRGLGNLPRVEIVRPWRGYAVGAIIRPPGVLRQVLVDQKIGVLVIDKPKRGRPKKVEEVVVIEEKPDEILVDVGKVNQLIEDKNPETKTDDK